MPVRIVKDNPDEEVVNDSFDFDNPNGGSNADNQNENQHQGGSGGGFDLGGIANMLFGGGGNSSNNSVLSSLASMAIGACVNYAISSFQNSRSGAGNFSSAAPSNQDVESLYQARMQAASLAVSTWAYAVGADRNFQGQEKQAVENLLNDTIQQLFPSNVANQDEVGQELSQIFSNPLPYHTIVGQASQNTNFAKQLYHQAALIVAADGSYEGREQSFLQTLAADLGLGASDIRAINQQFGF